MLSRYDMAMIRTTPDAHRDPGPLDRMRFIGHPALPYALAAAGIIAVAIFALLFAPGADDEPANTFPLNGEGTVTGEINLPDGFGPAVVSASGLDALPEDYVYQVWTLFEGGATGAAGTINPTANGEATGVIRIDPKDVTGIIVTIESLGSSFQPTSEPILSGELPRSP